MVSASAKAARTRFLTTTLSPARDAIVRHEDTILPELILCRYINASASSSFLQSEKILEPLLPRFSWSLYYLRCAIKVLMPTFTFMPIIIYLPVTTGSELRACNDSTSLIFY